ncbi:MAG: RluA family pseudouridine synthase [Firmicutes bacterium]|nr:RluA family pseudouridine synthase [Bacillota bacterium]
MKTQFENETITVDLDGHNVRLDVFVGTVLSQTRSMVKNLVTEKHILLDGKVVTKAGTVLKTGQVIEVSLPLVETGIVPSKIPLDILYQDDCLVVVNKQQGLAVHPSPGHQDDTLVNALLYCIDNLSGINGEIRPGIVHRLDKETSGVILVAKTNEAHLCLSTQFEKRTVKKKYIGIVEGFLQSESGTIHLPIARSKSDRKKMAIVEGGRPASTKFKALERLKKSTLVEFDILTGRTHQIRVHTKHLGNPIVGDVLYGSQKQCKNQLLHAQSITFAHPITGKNMFFTAPLPDYFEKFLKANKVSDTQKENL